MTGIVGEQFNVEQREEDKHGGGVHALLATLEAGGEEDGDLNGGEAVSAGAPRVSARLVGSGTRDRRRRRIRSAVPGSLHDLGQGLAGSGDSARIGKVTAAAAGSGGSFGGGAGAGGGGADGAHYGVFPGNGSGEETDGVEDTFPPTEGEMQRVEHEGWLLDVRFPPEHPGRLVPPL